MRMYPSCLGKKIAIEMILSLYLFSLWALGFASDQSNFMCIGQYHDKSLLLITWKKDMYLSPLDEYDSWQNIWYVSGSSVKMDNNWKWLNKIKQYEEFIKINDGAIENAGLVRLNDSDNFIFKGKKSLLTIDLKKKEAISHVTDDKIIQKFDKKFILSYEEYMAFFEIDKSKMSVYVYDPKLESKTIEYFYCKDGMVSKNSKDCKDQFQNFPEKITKGFLSNQKDIILLDNEKVYSFSNEGGYFKSTTQKDFIQYRSKTSGTTNLILVFLFLVIIVALIELCLLIKCGYDQAKLQEESEMHRKTIVAQQAVAEAGKTSKDVEAEQPSKDVGPTNVGVSSQPVDPNKKI